MPTRCRLITRRAPLVLRVQFAANAKMRVLFALHREPANGRLCSVDHGEQDRRSFALRLGEGPTRPFVTDCFGGAARVLDIWGTPYGRKG